MKKVKANGIIISVLLTFLITLTQVSPLKSISALEENTGKIYYKILLKTNTKLEIGETIFLSNNPSLEDEKYMSINFPDHIIDAELKVTSGLEDAQYSPADTQGYGVDVIKRDSTFDGCNDGHVFYVNENWVYYCNGGGARNKGPYTIYNTGVITFTREDLEIEIIDINKAISKDNIKIIVNTTEGPYTVTADEYTITDDSFNASKGDYDVEMSIGGMNFTIFITEEVEGSIDDLKNLTNAEKEMFKNLINKATSNKEINEILEEAKNMDKEIKEVVNGDFVKKYLKDQNGNIYREANKDNYQQILAGKDDWDKMDKDKKELINSYLLKNDGKTYEDLLKVAKEIYDKENKNEVVNTKNNKTVETSDDTSMILYSALISITSAYFILKRRRSQI